MDNYAHENAERQQSRITPIYSSSSAEDLHAQLKIEARTQVSWAKKDWLLSDPEERHQNVLATLNNNPAQLFVPYASIFFRRMMSMLVYTSNTMERTFPAGVEQQQTFRDLDNIAMSDNHTLLFETQSITPWLADGDGTTKKPRAQLVQHMRAARYLLNTVKMPLTVDIVKNTHKLLMAGAMEEGGACVKAGEFRDHPAHAENHTYPEGNPDELHAALLRIVETFNDSMKVSDGCSLITAPVRLFYDTITLHPFQNGNGRLCRLLFAFAVLQAGMPFPVPLTTGHRKARNHYMRAILRARRGDMDELHTMALMSIDAVLCNFKENIRLVGNYEAKAIARKT